jgi:hypothetical protein
MKKLDLKRMEVIHGGKLTEEEIRVFLGTASCVSAATGNYFALLGCYNFLRVTFK